jgi:hypothetical protein
MRGRAVSRLWPSFVPVWSAFSADMLLTACRDERVTAMPGGVAAVTEGGLVF